jgi:endogenous inhibitor of DNA gyrase (YacG/DUF329 family)
VSRAESAVSRPHRCPRCAASVVWKDNPNRPFCSLSCRLIDLGVWLDERYRIPGEAIAADTGSEDRGSTGGG